MMSRLLLPFLFVLAVSCGTDAPLPAFPDGFGLDTPVDDIGTTDAGEDVVDATADTPVPDGGEPDATEDVDADAEPDAIPDVPPGAELGEDCERNSDCESEICIPVDAERNVCTEACGECFAGWECLDEICRCSATVEVCDGLDNDCDGEIDEGESDALGCFPPEVCVDGSCACLSGVLCDGTCVDTSSDRLNCGDCGFACSDDTVCVGGACVCPEDFELCGDVCVDTTSDAEFCGNCDTACREGRVCTESECVCPGEFGMACGDVCVDSSTDPAHCGGCDAPCADDEMCADSACVCADGLLDCDDSCIDPVTDDENCGGCGIVCGIDELCEESVCECRPGLDRCDDACLNFAIDEANCGGCGIVCDPGDVCVDGTCGCPDGLTGCAGECVDELSDIRHCGGCDIACAANEICDGGACVCACPDGSCEDGLCVPLATGESETISFGFTAEPQAADIVFNMDTTGSMGGELANLRTALSSEIIPLARDVFADTGFAVTRYDDFPCGAHGRAGTDVPFQLIQRVTTDLDAVQDGVDALTLHNGADFPESAIESLFQIATGLGTDDCVEGAVAPFDPDLGFVDGVADGEVGGVGFRAGSFPIVVHITDATTHARGEADYAYGATREEAYDALDALDARVIGVSSGAASREFLLGVADATNARVPACAWDEDRPGTCGAEQCCTASGGSGRAPDAEGLCPLVFDIGGDGSGLDDSVVSGIDVLSRFSPFDVTLRVRPDATLLAESEFDTSCLLASTDLIAASDPPGGCGFEVEAADFDGDGVDDGATNVTAGTTVEFGFDLENACAPDPGVYPIHFDLLVGESAVFASTTAYVFVR